MKGIDPNIAEIIIKNVVLKTGKSEEDVRAALAAVLETNGCEVPVSLETQMALLSAHAGEQVVIENLNRIQKGLPHKSHRRLMEDIRSAQVRVKEKAVIDNLRAKGLPI